MTNGLFPPVKRDRRSRIKKLENMIKEVSNTSDKRKAIAIFCVDEGVSLRTVREYLDILKLAGKVEADVTI